MKDKHRMITDVDRISFSQNLTQALESISKLPNDFGTLKLASGAIKGSINTGKGYITGATVSSGKRSISGVSALEQLSKMTDVAFKFMPGDESLGSQVGDMYVQISRLLDCKLDIMAAISEEVASVPKEGLAAVEQAQALFTNALDYANAQIGSKTSTQETAEIPQEVYENFMELLKNDTLSEAAAVLKAQIIDGTETSQSTTIASEQSVESAPQGLAESTAAEPAFVAGEESGVGASHNVVVPREPGAVAPEEPAIVAPQELEVVTPSEAAIAPPPEAGVAGPQEAVFSAPQEEAFAGPQEAAFAGTQEEPFVAQQEPAASAPQESAFGPQQDPAVLAQHEPLAIAPLQETLVEAQESAAMAPQQAVSESLETGSFTSETAHPDIIPASQPVLPKPSIHQERGAPPSSWAQRAPVGNIYDRTANAETEEISSADCWFDASPGSSDLKPEAGFGKAMSSMRMAVTPKPITDESPSPDYSSLDQIPTPKSSGSFAPPSSEVTQTQTGMRSVSESTRMSSLRPMALKSSQARGAVSNRAVAKMKMAEMSSGLESAGPVILVVLLVALLAVPPLVKNSTTKAEAPELLSEQLSLAIDKQTSKLVTYASDDPSAREAVKR